MIWATPDLIGTCARMPHARLPSSATGATPRSRRQPPRAPLTGRVAPGTVRILIDYRPALRHRTGVGPLGGPTGRGTRRAPGSRRSGDHRLQQFLEGPTGHGAPAGRHRGRPPCARRAAELSLAPPGVARHRIPGPPYVRCRALAVSTADPVAARRSPDHHPRRRLSPSSRTWCTGSPTRLSGAGARPRAPGGRCRGAVSAHRRRSGSQARAAT